MVAIRPALDDDAASIAAIVNALLDTTTVEWRYEHYSLDSITEWMHAHETVLVAEVDGEVVGVAGYGPFRDVAKWPGYMFTVENTVHVREGNWRSGIGVTLMEALIDDARANGKHTMIAAVDGANESSIRFHERLGFAEVARMPEVGAKFGKWQNLVLLALRLDDRVTPRG